MVTTEYRVETHEERQRRLNRERQQRWRVRRKHQHHIAGKPRGSRRQRHAVAKAREQSRRCSQRRDQDRQQIRHILLEAQPKLVAVESLHPISMLASARGTVEHPGKNTKAKRKLNESLAESAMSENSSVRRLRNSAFPPPPSRRRARPRPARGVDTGTRTTARAKRYSGAGTAVSTPTPTGPPPSSFATGPTSDTANGGRVILRTY